MDKWTIQRVISDGETTETVIVPEGYMPCDHCKGAGKLGWRSLAHDPELALKRPCSFCGGLGYVIDYDFDVWS